MWKVLEAVLGAGNILPMSPQELIRRHYKGRKACHVCLYVSDLTVSLTFNLGR